MPSPARRRPDRRRNPRAGAEVPLEFDDLDELARAYLAVLAIGLAPADAAADPRLRPDHATAVTYALWRGEPPTRYLAQDEPTADLARRLEQAATSLEQAGVLDLGGPSPSLLTGLGIPVGLGPAAPPFDVRRPPLVLDKWLAQRCLDRALSARPVYSYLMERYADSSEVWQQLDREGHLG